MQADLVGRVRNTKLPIRNGLLALFEAIVNSIHAIEEQEQQEGYIKITIERENELPELKSQNILPNIKSFIIEDNGIGFNDGNYNAFCTLDSQVKAYKGAKGIGRVLWPALLRWSELCDSSQSQEFCRRDMRLFLFVAFGIFFLGSPRVLFKGG